MFIILSTTLAYYNIVNLFYLFCMFLLGILPQTVRNLTTYTTH